MDILPSGNIFRELQDIHDTGYFSSQFSIEDQWQQASAAIINIYIFFLCFVFIHLFYRSSFMHSWLGCGYGFFKFKSIVGCSLYYTLSTYPYRHRLHRFIFIVFF